MKSLGSMVVLLVALFLSVEGKSSEKHNRNYQNITKKVKHLTKPNRLNYEILSKRVKKERTGEKRQLPYHISEAEQDYERVPPVVDNDINLARDNVNTNSLPQSDEPRHIDEDPSQANRERNPEPRPMIVQRQDPSIESAGRSFNKDMENPTPQHIYGDSFQGSNQDPAMLVHQAADLRSQQQDSSIDNTEQTDNTPQHTYDEPNPGPNQNPRRLSQGPPQPDPSIVNLPAPLNIRIVKKFFPVPIVHRVAKPIPVMETRVVPIPVHQRRFHYVPRPFVQPFSRNPDVHLSYLHLDKRANPCRHGGIIVQSPGGYTCLCRKAYKGRHCEEKDKCYPFPCKNDGDCIDHGTHYECKCSRRFKGIHCEVEDKCYDHPCKNGGTCNQLLSDVKCSCRSGYKGSFCQDLDYCIPNPCRNGGICQEMNQEASCKCTPLFKGSRCQVPQICSPNLCRNGGTCREEKPDDPCECATGFAGDYCTEDVCQPNPCKNDGVCYPLRGDYNSTWYGACKCRETYKGDWCQIPNPCASNPSPCIHGICYDAYTNAEQVDLSVDGLSCQCYEGYFGTYCREKKCDHCDTNARCPDGLKCSCNDGYQGDGHICKKIPELCVPNPCENDGICRPDENTFECKCAPGFKGKTCHDKDPCSGLVSPCKNGGTCIEHGGDYSCICADDWKGKDCSDNSTNLCLSQPCLNGGTCKVSEDSKSWYCICRGSRFKPPDCACVCPANAHDRSEKNLTCDNPEGVCMCPQGFQHDHDRDVCVDSDDGIIGGADTGKPCHPNPCKNGGTCDRLPDSGWKCNCMEGWKGTTCEEKDPIRPGRTPCLPNPCLNNGSCITVRESYDCICDQQFTGPHCEVDRCIKCDPVKALCNHGKCLCKPGYVGNGYQCVAPPKKQEIICVKCHPVYAVCLNNNCQCKNGFVGDGYQCTPVQSGNTLTNQVVPWF